MRKAIPRKSDHKTSQKRRLDAKKKDRKKEKKKGRFFPTEVKQP